MSLLKVDFFRQDTHTLIKRQIRIYSYTSNQSINPVMFNCPIVNLVFMYIFALYSFYFGISVNVVAWKYYLNITSMVVVTTYINQKHEN